MPDTDLQLTFGADASGVTRGVDEAMTAIADFDETVDALRKSLAQLGGQTTQGLAGVQRLGTTLQVAGAAGANGLSDSTRAAEALSQKHRGKRPRGAARRR